MCKSAGAWLGACLRKAAKMSKWLTRLIKSTAHGQWRHTCTTLLSPLLPPPQTHLYALQLRSPMVFMSSLHAASLGGLGGRMDACSTAVV
jgi:hypothetical protein